MKPGFLLRAEAKKFASKRRDAQKRIESSAVGAAVPHKGSDGDERKAADNNQSDEGKVALPSGYDLEKGELLYKRISGSSKDIIVITTIPHSVSAGEAQAVWVVNASTKPKVLNNPGYLARIPKPRPDLYQVVSTDQMEEGVFAKRDIKCGEIIIAERPLLVIANAIRQPSLSSGMYPIKTSELESLLDAAIARLSPESQADFRALANAYPDKKKAPLLGILKTNNYGAVNLFDGSNMSATYDVVGKVLSRLNHSCIPNVKFYFKVNSFSAQIYALCDIKAGDQLFFSYCHVCSSLGERRVDLLPYGFECKCAGCVNATRETDELRTTAISQVENLKATIMDRPKIEKEALDEALRLEKDMVKEGLHALGEYVVLLMVISAGYSKLGKVAESRKYGALVDKFQKFTQDEWRGIQIPQM